MNAAELHAKLSVYLAQSPENGYAIVVLRQAGSDFVFDISGANDAKQIGGGHMLILLPDESKPPVGVKEMRVQ